MFALMLDRLARGPRVMQSKCHRHTQRLAGLRHNAPLRIAAAQTHGGGLAVIEVFTCRLAVSIQKLDEGFSPPHRHCRTPMALFARCSESFECRHERPSLA